MTDPRMTPTNDAPVTVEQCDRDFAADILDFIAGLRSWPDEIQHTADVMRQGAKGRLKFRPLVEMLARHRLAALASAPAGDGVEQELRAALGVARRAIVQAAKDTLWCDDAPAETVVDRIDAALARPRAAVGEQSREWWTLEWIAAQRPPVHMKPMRGSQDFDTAEAVLAFWRGKPADSTYVGLTRHVQTSTLQSPPAKVEG